MGRKSTRENKTIYQICREACNLTREAASEYMAGLSASRIEKIEKEVQNPTPYDIVEMAKCYKKPDLCNHYCARHCDIGKKYVPEIHVDDLHSVVIETIASLSEMSQLTGRMIQIARDGKINPDEIQDFARISLKLDALGMAIDALNLWLEKTALEGKMDVVSFQEEKRKLLNK